MPTSAIASLTPPGSLSLSLPSATTTTSNLHSSPNFNFLRNCHLLSLAMYSRSPSRNHRSRGFKVNHILQVCLLVAVCFWLIYQVKHSHEKKKEFGEKDGELSSQKETHGGGEVLRLGRKDISTVTDDKLLKKDVEENESEIDEHVEEKIDDENHEEFAIDENNEDNEEVESVLEDQEQDEEGKDENAHGAREQHYKGDDASSEVAQDAGIIVPDTVNTTVIHIDENAELTSDGKKNVTGNSNEQLLEENPEGANIPGLGSLTSSSLTNIERERPINMTRAQKANNTDFILGENRLDLNAVKNSTEHVNNFSEGSLGSSGEVNLSTAENVTEFVLMKTGDENLVNAGTDKIRSSDSENIGENEPSVPDTNVDKSAGNSLMQEEKEGRRRDLDAPSDIKVQVEDAGEVEAG